MNFSLSVTLQFITAILCLFSASLGATGEDGLKYVESVATSTLESPGSVEVCVESDVATVHQYTLKISKIEEFEKIEMGKGKEVKMCGPITITSSVTIEEAVAIDAYGHFYSQNDIRIPKKVESVSNNSNSSISSNCGCDQLGFDLNLLEPYFEDCIYETGVGFADPAIDEDGQIVGEARREVICASLQYLERLIVPNQSICNPVDPKKVNIRILPSYNIPIEYPLDVLPFEDDVLGYASPLFTPYNFYVGVRHSWPWEIINSGEYPTASIGLGSYHTQARFNFVNYADDWNLDYEANDIGDNFDLFSVALHEFTHAIGFLSAFISTEGELGSREGLGRYNNFDQNLRISYDGSNTFKGLIENGETENGFPFSSLWYFNDEVDGLGINNPNNPSDLHSSCPGAGPHISFQGQIGNHPIYTGETFEQSSSFSH